MKSQTLRTCNICEMRPGNHRRCRDMMIAGAPNGDDRDGVDGPMLTTL